MRDYFTFGNINSADFGCYVANANQFDAPARDVKSVEVPGRNGALTIDNGRYKNQEVTYSMYVRGDIQNRISGLRNALTETKGYLRLEDTYNPNEFYLARFINAFSVKKSDRYRAGFSVTFDRKPQRFLKTGETVIELATNGNVFNDTTQIARPMLRVYGTGSFTIGVYTMTISAADVYTDIDCDLMDAFKGTTNCNGNVSGSFPLLHPGENAVTLGTGISKIEITPRWWKL